MAAKAASSRAATMPKQAAHFTKQQILPASAAVLVAIFILYNLDRRPPLLLGDPDMSTHEITPGHTLTVDWTQDWQRLCPGEVTRQIVTAHGEVKTFAKFGINPPPKTGQVQRQSVFYVPHSTPPGDATITSTIAFSCNWLQSYWPIVVKAPPLSVKVAALDH